MLDMTQAHVKHKPTSQPLRDRVTPQQRQSLEASKTPPESADPLLSHLQKQFSAESDVSMNTLLAAKVAVDTEALYRQAHFDSLTHIPNRHSFNEKLESLMIESHNNTLEFAILFLDLDGFKAVNDTLGHRAGDDLLRHVAARLVFAVRDEDTVFRLGGDEFVVLLPNITDHQVIEAIAKRIILEISLDYWIEQTPVHISTSIGVARFPLDGQTASDLVGHADEALYAAKTAGKGVFVFYDETYISPKAQEVEQVQQLRQSIEQGQLELVHQVARAEQKQMSLLELQWQAQPYEKWQALLPKTGKARQVGQWLIDQAFYQLSQQNLPNLAVPLIPEWLLQPEIISTLAGQLDARNLKKAQLIFRLSTQQWQQASAELRDAMVALGQDGYPFVLLKTEGKQIQLDVYQQLPVTWTLLEKDWLTQQITQAPHEDLKTLIELLHLLKQTVACEQKLADKLHHLNIQVDATIESLKLGKR